MDRRVVCENSDTKENDKRETPILEKSTLREATGARPSDVLSKAQPLQLNRTWTMLIASGDERGGMEKKREREMGRGRVRSALILYGEDELLVYESVGSGGGKKRGTQTRGKRSEGERAGRVGVERQSVRRVTRSVSTWVVEGSVGVAGLEMSRLGDE